MRGRCTSALALLALGLGATAATAAPGDLDPGFDGDGTRVINHSASDFATAALVQADGRIVVAGHGVSNITDVIVTRFNADGALDPSFDSDGIRTIDLGGGDNVSAAALQADGKIVVVGRTSPTLFNQNMAVLRLQPGGALDPSFDGDGTRAIDHGGSDSAAAVVVQPDGKLVLAGYGTAAEDIVVTRLNPDGSSDPSFGGGDGTAAVNLGAADTASSVALQADGKVVVAGSTNSNAAVVRLNIDGSVDGSFGRDGTRTIDYGGNDAASDVLVQPDARIVVAGSGGASNDMEVTRLNPDGSNDASFDGDGTIGIDFGGQDFGSAAALQANGKIVVAGGAGQDAGVARLQPGGSLDTSFSFDGRQTISPSEVNAAYAAALQGNGRIVVAGYAITDGNIDWLVGRLDGDSVAAGGGPANPPGGGPGGAPGDGRGPGGGGPGRSVPRCNGKRATIVGSTRADRLKGTRRPDVIVALGGNDRISAGRGDDTICAGDGRDRIDGGPGNDRLDGGNGNDQMAGQDGRDTLLGRSGRDQLNGGAGRDRARQ